MDAGQSSSVSKPKKRPITRNRESLACVQCRARKLKCDRGQPCSTCVRREEPESCTYGRPSDRDEAPSRERITQGEARLQHLERLVEDFIRGKSAPPSESTGSASVARDDYVSMDARMTENGRFLGSTHYSAMLDDIQELKDILYMAGDNYDETPTLDTQNIDEFSALFGGTPCPTLPVILSRHLPSRAETDRRVAAYFRSTTIAAPYIHVPQFQRQYHEFWNDHLRTSPLWISMLFCICQISKGMTPDVTDDPSDRDFSIAAAFCLAVGHYHRPQRFTVEAQLLYIQCNIITRMDLPRDVGTLLATCVRTAYTMGYHRDPDHFKHVSVFAGEMRRRTWNVCLQMDLLISFQLGLPSGVQPDSWDTRPLRNLLDTDLAEDAPVLPPARAPTEPTPALFYNAKQHLMNGFPRVLKHALSPSPPPSSTSLSSSAIESELLAVDAALRRSYAEIPEALKWRPSSTSSPSSPRSGSGSTGSVAGSMGDPISAIVTSRCLDQLYQKSLCVLHRRHVSAGRAASIRVCGEAASAIVRNMLEVAPAVQPGRPLWGERWSAFGALAWNDFLLGLMVLCLILRQRRSVGRGGEGEEGEEWEEREREMLGLLRASRALCVEKAGESRECHRIIRLLDAVLADAVTGSEAAEVVMGEASGTETGEMGFDLEGRVWSPIDTNLFDAADWMFLEESFEGNLR